MAAHLAKQIPEAPDGSQSISSTILASCLFSAFNGNSLDELSASLAVLQTDEFKVMLNRLLVQMQGFDWLFFFFFFHPPLMNVRGTPPDAFYCCCKVIDALASAAFTHVTCAEKHISIREDSTDVYFSNEKNYDINL